MIQPPSDHPGDEALRALSLGRLTEVELAPVSAHLGECPACCRRIDQLATDDRLLARLQQSAASREEVLVSPAQRRSAVRALRRSRGAGSAARRQDPEIVPVILSAPRWVGDYDILAEVGRGGMGVVYKARHRGLHRLAALKMVLAGEFASPAQELRFRLEAELAARVQHPNIVPIYEIGGHDGRPFLAMEWVEGGSLASRLDGRPWPPGEAAALVEILARAIDVAHREGVVHRDLKPGNILLALDPTRERQEPTVGPPAGGPGYPRDSVTGGVRSSSYIPKISDFGLAKLLESDRGQTESRAHLGTPGYAAPEQMDGNSKAVGPAADVYALGAILYEVLTGRPPFKGSTVLETVQQVIHHEPVSPRLLDRAIPRDLEVICLKCLEKKATQRHPDAASLAEDLRRWQNNEPILVRPPTAFDWAAPDPLVLGASSRRDGRGGRDGAGACGRLVAVARRRHRR